MSWSVIFHFWFDENGNQCIHDRVYMYAYVCMLCFACKQDISRRETWIGVTFGMCMYPMEKRDTFLSVQVKGHYSKCEILQFNQHFVSLKPECILRFWSKANSLLSSTLQCTLFFCVPRWMQDESTKKTPDWKKVKALMEITFHERRGDITNKMMVQDIKEKYPFLFSITEV